MTFQKSITLTLSEIFNKGNHCFEIPDYQRAYSWEKDQRQDLINDIENILKISNYKHFTGTIVAQEKQSKIDKDTYFDIIDGQQRLTSLIILLSVLHQGEYLDAETRLLIETNFLFKGRESGNTVRLFKLNGELDGYFFRKLEQWDYTSEEHNTKAHTNIDNAFTQFKDWLDLKKESPDFAFDVYKVITERLGFLFHVPASTTEVGLMFEVINNRGKKLSELEKIKNYLIYYAQKTGYRDIYTAVQTYWGKILFNLNACGQTSNEEEDSFLRFTWIVFQDVNKSKSYHVYDNLKEIFPTNAAQNWQRLKSYIEFIAEAAKAYNRFYTRDLISSEKEKKVVAKIQFQASTASIMPLFLSIYAKVNNGEQRFGLLELIEKLNFRYYGCGIANRSDTGNGQLFLLANQFFNGYENHKKEHKEDASEWLKKGLIDFIDRECGTESFVKALMLDKDESGDFYGWNNLKYFLANYEEYIAVKNGEKEDFKIFLLSQDTESKNANFEKEHIIARKELSVIKTEDDFHKRRLGNFALLRPSTNKTVQDKPLFEKFELYREDTPKYLTMRSLNELEKLYGDETLKEGAEKYNQDTIALFLDKREEKLLNFAISRWGIGESKKVIVNSFNENTKIYSFE